MPGVLRALAGDSNDVEVECPSVEAALAELVQRYPQLRRHLFDERGRLRGYLNVYLNEEDVRFLDGLRTRLRPSDVITIVPSVAGGSRAAFSESERVRCSRHPARSGN